jgi:DNA-binding ferritin-like protein
MNSLNGKISYATMTYVCALFANDSKVTHWGASGLHFGEIHELAQEYYEYLSAAADWFAERAILNGQELDNLTNLREHITPIQWPALPLVTYDFDTFLDKILERGQVFIECLENVDDLGHTDERSKMDEFLEYWRLEVEYKNKMRKGAPETQGILSSVETDVNLPEVQNDFRGPILAVVRSPNVTREGLNRLP